MGADRSAIVSKPYGDMLKASGYQPDALLLSYRTRVRTELWSSGVLDDGSRTPPPRFPISPLLLDRHAPGGT